MITRGGDVVSKRISFQKKEEWFQFYSANGEKVNRKTEIRIDPLTKESSRIVFDPGTKFTVPDYTEEAKETSGKNCPFCPDNIMTMTPEFSKEVVSEGRVQVGEAILFPNLFPYSKYNGVVVFSKEHYVRLEAFTKEMITNAFQACQTFLQQVKKVEKEGVYTSINWNYLPYSGGSILHPHMHVLVSETPTNFQRTIITHTKRYQEETGADYFNELYHAEKDGERWIGEHGNVGWFHAFSPKSHNDFQFIFKDKTSLDGITEGDWEDFAKGLQAIFATLTEQGMASFNMVMHISGDEALPITGRFIPRLTIGGLGTSDINFFQSLHQESLSYKIPEEVAALARKHFQ